MNPASYLSRVFARVSPKWQDSLDKQLVAAAVQGDPEKVWRDMSRLIAKGANVNACDGDMPLLCRVSERGMEFVAERLLEAGVAPDAKTAEGETPFLLAARRGWPRVMTLLADAGANLQAKRSDGKNAMDLLLLGVNDHPDAIPRYREDYKILTEEAQLSMSLEQRKEIFTRNRACSYIDAELDGEVGLREAVLEGSLKKTEALLAAGVKPDSAAKYEVNRALYDAISNGHAEIVRVLVSAGANVRRSFARDDSTPLTLAARHGSEEIFKTLLDGGADPTQPVILRHLNGGTTELKLSDIALTHKHPELAEFIEVKAKAWADRPPDVTVRRDVNVGAPLTLVKPSGPEPSMVMNPLTFKKPAGQTP